MVDFVPNLRKPKVTRTVIVKQNQIALLKSDILYVPNKASKFHRLDCIPTKKQNENSAYQPYSTQNC
jgi:hypothetical protein